MNEMEEKQAKQEMIEGMLNQDKEDPESPNLDVKTENQEEPSSLSLSFSCSSNLLNLNQISFSQYQPILQSSKIQNNQDLVETDFYSQGLANQLF